MSKNELICHIVTRKMYAYIAEIKSVYYYEKDGKWYLFYDCIWDDNGIPKRESGCIKKFDTEDEARRYKVGDRIDEREISLLYDGDGKLKDRMGFFGFMNPYT